MRGELDSTCTFRRAVLSFGCASSGRAGPGLVTSGMHLEGPDLGCTRRFGQLGHHLKSISLLVLTADSCLFTAYGPPTPTATSPSHSHLPSFLSDDPLSDDPNSSSDDDSDGNAKPPRAPRFDSHGLRRPTPSY